MDLQGNNQNLPRALGDSTSGEGNGRSVTVSTTESYLDISSHISEFEGLSEGTISFWVKPSGSGDRTIFSASDSDKKSNTFQLNWRNVGPVQLTAVNDGVKVSEFYTNVNLSSGTIDWRHGHWLLIKTKRLFGWMVMLQEALLHLMVLCNSCLFLRY